MNEKSCHHRIIFSITKFLFTRFQYQTIKNLFWIGFTPKVFFGPKMILVVDDPEQLNILLNSKYCIEKSSIYKGIFFGKGLLLAKENMWKVHHKIIQPAFTTKILNKLV